MFRPGAVSLKSAGSGSKFNSIALQCCCDTSCTHPPRGSDSFIGKTSFASPSHPADHRIMYFEQPTAPSTGSGWSQDESLQYDVTIRQQPLHARISAMKTAGDRRPVDPPMVVQLSVRDPRDAPAEGSSPASSQSSASSDQDVSTRSHLTNPYYFMYATLVEPHEDTEVNFVSDGARRSTTGALVSSLRVLKDHPNSEADAAFFIFPDICVRLEGSWRFKLSLFVLDGNSIKPCKTIYSAPFFVYPGKQYPGVGVSTPLTRALAAQGVKLRIRKEIREKTLPTQVKDEPVFPNEETPITDAIDFRSPRKRRRTRSKSLDTRDSATHSTTPERSDGAWTGRLEHVSPTTPSPSSHHDLLASHFRDDSSHVKPHQQQYTSRPQHPSLEGQAAHAQSYAYIGRETPPLRAVDGYHFQSTPSFSPPKIETAFPPTWGAPRAAYTAPEAPYTVYFQRRAPTSGDQCLTDGYSWASPPSPGCNMPVSSHSGHPATTQFYDNNSVSHNYNQSNVSHQSGWGRRAMYREAIP
ncbi:velvet factor-domain-containing protein [Mycena rebaudengoi]|nr:velvet factor-domain-containing protein [Mycena rebaudengoi]